MLTKMYSVYDEKAEIFNKPFLFTNHGQAIRAFGETCLDKSSMLAKYPSDYKLYYIGTFNEESSLMTSVIPPQVVSSATEFNKYEDIPESVIPFKK